MRAVLFALVVLVAVFMANTTWASIDTNDYWLPLGSQSQFDHIQAKIAAPGTYSFSGVGEGTPFYFDGGGDGWLQPEAFQPYSTHGYEDSWGQVYNDGTLLTASGDVASLGLQFKLHFGDSSHYVFHIQGYLGEDRVFNADVYKAAGGWWMTPAGSGHIKSGSWDQQSPITAPIPEPTSLLIWSAIALGGLGLAYRRRKIQRA